jgi:energy-coupling factor transport system permease protein
MTRLGAAPALFPSYRPRASALHTARAAIAAAYCLALALVFVLFEHPLVLGAGVAAVVAAGVGAGVARELGRAARLGLAIAALVVLINPLVSSEGETLLVRGWAVLGHRFDITLEAVAYGGVAGLRLLGLVLAFAVFSLVIDPDELLRALRRISYRSALTVALATRLVPLLARDASRRGEAARCRARPASRTTLARAALAGSLERAVEVAAALEVRGYAGAGAVRRGYARRGLGALSHRGRVRHERGGHATAPARRSRHDARVALGAVGLVAVAVAGAAAGLAPFAAYPRFELALGAGELALAAAVVLVALVPQAGAGARLGIARTAAGQEGVGG